MNVIQLKTGHSDTPILFEDLKHHLFYKEQLQRTRQEHDVYHQAFFYLLGLTAETRLHIAELYNFDGGEIKADGLKAEWQTETTLRVCRLAFHLYDGYAGEGTKESPYDYMPCDLFRCEHMGFMLEAIKIRYPEYCIHTNIKKKG